MGSLYPQVEAVPVTTSFRGIRVSGGQLDGLNQPGGTQFDTDVKDQAFELKVNSADELELVLSQKWLDLLDPAIQKPSALAQNQEEQEELTSQALGFSISMYLNNLGTMKSGSLDTGVGDNLAMIRRKKEFIASFLKPDGKSYDYDKMAKETYGLFKLVESN